ncbi:ABC transporter permease [Pedosphaera parvula]|uniref:Cyclic nucleotide-binding protein n=1 Tax=Pedosphaera parvula (strain Ellin514) TaxID=320771 RepID=B9XK03_PEDPL|nr:ABC transporter permease [Pedosphaera parvula]EEF59826.1 cyclic nucleotide-binding protein [Pedosphaera parvula Ellin514]
MNPALPLPKTQTPVAVRKGFSLGWLLTTLGPFLGLLLVVGLFSALPDVRPYFLTGANFKIIFTQTVIVAIGALGMTMIIISGGIDLSVGSVVALTSVVGATLLLKNVPPLLVVLLTILAGGLVGMLNGTVIAGFKMMPFIVTLGMMGIARGAAKWLSNSQTVNAPENAINSIMALNDPDHFFPLPPGVWIAIGLACVMSIVMRRTVFGRYIFAIGSNEAAARLCGIRVRWQKTIIYSVAGLFFGLAGLMQLSRLTQGDPTVANGLELDIIAAVVIGGASLNGGIGGILGSMIGALIMAVLRNGSNQMGLQTYMQEILIGLVIIFAVGLDKLRQRRRA